MIKSQRVQRDLTRPAGVRVQKVQRVRPAFGRLVQRVVVAADAADYKKGARLRRGLCRRVVEKGS